MKARTFFIILTIAGLAALGWYASRHGAGSGGQASAPGGMNHPATNTAPPIPEATAESATLRGAKELIRAGSDAAKKSVLDSLKTELDKLSPTEQSSAIRRLLDAHLDAPTGLGFKIANKGQLTEAPTLRTFLLNRLGADDPVAAAVYARQILKESASPDEWAVALRNLANGDSSADARDVLIEKTRSLLTNTNWQNNPSVGYLEAFDTAVYLNDPSFVPVLSDLVSRKDNQAVAHAAFLSLDRLILQQPAQILAALQQHPEWMSGREETRANYFARADVSDPVQRAIVETYLLNPSPSSKELATFAGIFPNANLMLSENLLTSNINVDATSLHARDAASLQSVNEWLADPRFANIRGQLNVIHSRLIQFTSQAAK